MKIIPLALFSVLISLVLHAQSESDNISISQQTETYEFIKGTNDNPVLVKEKYSVKYKCNGYRTVIPFVEFYDDKSSIDDVDIYVSGDKAKDIKPEYSYYSIDDYFYSDAHVCYFKLPLEKKGNESQVNIEKTINDPRYFTNVFLDEMYNVESKHVVIIVPDWMKIEVKEYNFPATGITKNIDRTSGSTVYNYTITNLPARKSNGHAQGPTYVYPHLLIMSQSAEPPGMAPVTYFKSLQNQYNWYHSLISQLGNDPASFKDKVQELIKDKKTDEEKMVVIYNWVQSNVRYIAFEDGIAGYKPEKAQEVYRKKYGDCKGMANLTKEMLKVAGFDARLCWLGTSHIAYDYSTPSLAVDNHMICAVKLNNKFVYLDATEKYIGYGEYAERIQGRQVLIENGDQYILEKVPVETAVQNTESIKQVLKIDSGRIVGSVNINYKGESKEYMLFELNSVLQQKRDNALMQFITDNDNNYKVQNLKVSDVNNWNKDLSIQYDLKYDNAVTEFGDEKYLELDRQKEFANMDIDTSRKLDYVLPYKYNISNSTELTLPAGFTVEQLPQPLTIKTDAYSFNLQYIVKDNKLIYTKAIELYKPSIKVHDFTAWNADILKLKNFYNEQITLKKL